MPWRYADGKTRFFGLIGAGNALFLIGEIGENHVFLVFLVEFAFLPLPTPSKDVQSSHAALKQRSNGVVRRLLLWRSVFLFSLPLLRCPGRKSGSGDITGYPIRLFIPRR